MSRPIQIVELHRNNSIEIPFPEKITRSNRTNWESADVAFGLKPLSYANREPEEITLENITLDTSATTQESVETVIGKLRDLMKESGGTSDRLPPPPLVVFLADRQFRCVLTEMRISNDFYTKQNVCIRAVLTLTFQELPPLERRRVV